MGSWGGTIAGKGGGGTGGAGGASMPVAVSMLAVLVLSSLPAVVPAPFACAALSLPTRAVSSALCPPSVPVPVVAVPLAAVPLAAVPLAAVLVSEAPVLAARVSAGGWALVSDGVLGWAPFRPLLLPHLFHHSATAVVSTDGSAWRLEGAHPIAVAALAKPKCRRRPVALSETPA